jgi:hypothetical protein
MTTTREPRVDTTQRRRRRFGWRLGLAGAACLALPAAVFAIDSLSVQIPLLPAVGESTAQACDDDGVSTSYTYGNTSANGIKVTSVTVADISTDCTTVTVDFMNGETTVDSYNGTVGGSSVTLTTNIFTNTFNSVRVLLNP